MVGILRVMYGLGAVARDVDRVARSVALLAVGCQSPVSDVQCCGWEMRDDAEPGVSGKKVADACT